ncbi:rod shape-determining protein MreD [Acetobacterium sp.]|uniref:rod shape-determining protein MreD n=1 Tax=Acetobacterium sp. TaxID=1872094 RepID=UPI002F41BE1E
MRYAILFLILVIELIFSSTVLQIFSFFGSAPEVLLITIMLYSMIFQKKEAIILALAIGVLSDILYGPSLGVNTIAFGLIACIISWMSGQFSRHSIITSILSLIVTVILYYSVIYLLLLLFQNAMPLMIYLRRFNLQYFIINLVFMFVLRYFILKLSQHPAFTSDVLV